MTWDILIRGGTLIDGSGRPGEIGDVAVRAGRITAIGRSLPEGAAKVIDAEGLAVTPGFIDIKTFTADDGERVSLVMFESPETQAAWRTQAEHRAAQKRGRDEFYESYAIQVCRVVSERAFP